MKIITKNCYDKHDLDDDALIFFFPTAYKFASRVDLNLYQRNIIIPRDQPFVLNCPIIGYPTPTITWQKGQVPLRSTTDHTLLSNGSLFFPSFQITNQGYYICEGNNNLGRDRSPDIVLQAACKKF